MPFFKRKHHWASDIFSTIKTRPEWEKKEAYLFFLDETLNGTVEVPVLIKQLETNGQMVAKFCVEVNVEKWKIPPIKIVVDVDLEISNPSFLLVFSLILELR